MVPPFTQDRLTWLAYLMLAYCAYIPGVFGLVMPLLRCELDLSYKLGGLQHQKRPDGRRSSFNAST